MRYTHAATRSVSASVPMLRWTRTNVSWSRSSATWSSETLRRMNRRRSELRWVQITSVDGWLGIGRPRRWDYTEQAQAGDLASVFCAPSFGGSAVQQADLSS